MNDKRERRAGLNEVLFRGVNEQIRGLDDELGEEDGTITVISECSDTDCTERIVLLLSDTSASVLMPSSSVSSAISLATATLRMTSQPSEVLRDSEAVYDEKLADRIRSLLGGRAGVGEKKMFGGLAFMIGGNMAIAAGGQGGILVRVDPEESDELVATTSAELMEMRGRSMAGWRRVDIADVANDNALREWVERGAAYAESLGHR